MAKKEALPELPFELWEKGWVIWSKQRKRARMAQFIVEHLQHNRLAQWIDITKGKFQLCNWQDLAQEWYREKERGSDITDATSMLRKGLPRAFPGLTEVKSEAVKEGTQYVKRVFQANDALLHDVLRCALQGEFHPEGSPSSGDDDQQHMGIRGLKHSSTSPGVLVGAVTTQQKIHPMYQTSFSQAALSTPHYTHHRMSPNSQFPPEMHQQHHGGGFTMENPFGHPFASLGNIPGMSLMANPDYQLAPAEPSSVSTTSPCHPDSTWTGTDSAIESIGPDEILQSSLSPITQVQSPSASASSVQSPYPSPFGGGLTTDMYNPTVSAESYTRLMSPMQQEGSMGSMGEASYPVTPQPQPDQSQMQAEPMQMKVSPKRSPLSGGEAIYLFAVGNEPFPDGPVTLIFFSSSLQLASEIDMTRANPYTFAGMVPAHLHAEIVNLHVVFNGQPVLEEEFEYYDATPAPSDFLTGDVHQQLSQLHLLLGEVLQTTSMAGSDSREISQQQQAVMFQHLQSLLQFVARLGVLSLARLLLQLPQSGIAVQRRGSDDLLPEEVARAHGHLVLSQCMQKMRERFESGEDTNVDEILSVLGPTVTKASDYITAVVSALVREQRAAAELKRSMTPEASEETRRTAEEHCIQNVVRSHLAKVQQQQYSEVVEQRDVLREECSLRKKNEHSLEQETKQLHSELSNIHSDRLFLLQMTARWQLKGNELLQYFHTMQSNVTRAEARAVAMREQKKQAMEERDGTRKQMAELQEEKGALKKELTQTRLINSKLAGDLEHAKLEASSAQNERDWAFEERTKAQRENTKLREECSSITTAWNSSIVAHKQLKRDYEELLFRNDDLKAEIEQLREEADYYYVGDLPEVNVDDLPEINVDQVPINVEQSLTDKDSAIGSIDSRSVAGSVLSESSVMSSASSVMPGGSTAAKTERQKRPSMTRVPSLSKKSVLKHVNLGKAKALADLGLQIEPSFLITDFTVGYVQGLERGDRITMINGQSVQASNVKDLKKQLESCLKKGDLKLSVESQLQQLMPRRSSGTVDRPDRLLIQTHDSESSLHSYPPKGTLAVSPAVSYPFDKMLFAPRSLVIHKHGEGLGFKVNGGNAVGIFVSAVAPQTTSQGVKKMDQLLEVNGINLRSATAEEALIVLKEILSDEKAETVAVVAQFNPNKYQCLKETQHDSFHVRCQIRPRFHEPKDLEIKRGDILHVTNSREDDNSYLAWKVNSDGTEVERGTIPNAARACKMRRLGVTLEPYQRVRQQKAPFARPVLIMGPLADAVKTELLKIEPTLFEKCSTRTLFADVQELNQRQERLQLIEYTRQEAEFLCVAVEDLQKISQRHKHCLLDVSMFAIPELLAADLPPIIISLESKSVSSPPVTPASEKLECHATLRGDNVTELCGKVCRVIDQEQTKPVWLSV